MRQKIKHRLIIIVLLLAIAVIVAPIITEEIRPAAISATQITLPIPPVVNEIKALPPIAVPKHSGLAANIKPVTLNIKTKEDLTSLKNTLRASGFPAYLSGHNNPQLFVGPMLSREDASKTQLALKQQFKLASDITAFSLKQ